MAARKLYTGSDHAGFELRARMVAHLRALGFEVEDLGTPSAESTDYPDWAAAVGRAVRDHAGSLGVLVCGTGLGVCMAANKINGVRAADAWNVESARLSRAHNNANVLCVGSRLVPEAEAFSIVDATFAPVFRYFDVFDRIADFGIFEDLPRVRAWRKALASRPSVRRAVDPRYPELLTRFLERRGSALSQRMAAAVA